MPGPASSCRRPSSEWRRNVVAAAHRRLQLHDAVYGLDEPVLLPAGEVESLPRASAGSSHAGFDYLLLRNIRQRAGHPPARGNGRDRGRGTWLRPGGDRGLTGRAGDGGELTHLQPVNCGSFHASREVHPGDESVTARTIDAAGARARPLDESSWLSIRGCSNRRCGGPGPAQRVDRRRRGRRRPRPDRPPTDPRARGAADRPSTDRDWPLDRHIASGDAGAGSTIIERENASVSVFLTRQYVDATIDLVTEVRRRSDGEP